MTIVTKVCYSRSESIVIKGMLNVVSGNDHVIDTTAHKKSSQLIL